MDNRKVVFQVITTLATLSSHNLPPRSLVHPETALTNYASSSSFWQSIDVDFTLWLDYIRTRVEAHQTFYHVTRPTDKLANSRILVDLNGAGQFSSIQKAVDSIPLYNSNRVVIDVNAGIYKERVLIPESKPFITLEGRGRESTIVVWSEDAAQARSTFGSATVAVNSIGFIAKNITFRNSFPAQQPGTMYKQAVAFRISGDEAAFYGCGFEAHQDTLYDQKGRHYFEDCYVEGSIDFIFGNGQSLYKHCELHVVPITPGSLTAQSRSQPDQDTGFCFLRCSITGNGVVYLGRAWGPFSRVVFIYTYMADIIIPQGWYNWGDQRRQETVFYGQYKCSGPGASGKGRVPWVHELTDIQARPFLLYDGLGFIDGGQWLPMV